MGSKKLGLRLLTPVLGLMVAALTTVPYQTEAQSCSGPISLPYFQDWESGNSLSDYPCWAQKYGGNSRDDAEIDDGRFNVGGAFSGNNTLMLNDGADAISPEITELPNGNVELTFYASFEDFYDEPFEIGLVDQQPSSPSGSYSNYVTYQKFTYVSSNPNTSNYEFTNDETYRKYTLKLSNTSKIGSRKHIVFNRDNSTFGETGIEDINLKLLIKKDIEVSQVVSPSSQCQFRRDQSVTVEYVSKGTDTLFQGTSFPVTYTFNGNTFTETHTTQRDIGNGETFTHTFSSTIAASNLGTDQNFYNIETTVNWSNDQKGDNDTLETAFKNEYSSPQPQNVLNDTICNTNTATLKVDNPIQKQSTVYKWFNRPVNGLQLVKGDSLQTPPVFTEARFDTFYTTRRDSVTPPLKITEFIRENNNFNPALEIASIADEPKNFNGWTVVYWAEDLNSPRGFDKMEWDLGRFQAKEVKCGKVNQEFDDDIFFSCGTFFGAPDPVAAAIVDPKGNVSDFAAVNATSAEIQNLSVNVNGFTITYSDVDWNGGGIDVGASECEDYWQRVGTGDSDDNSDWANNSLSCGSENANLDLSAFSTGACPSSAKPVAVDVRPNPTAGFDVAQQICATDTIQFVDTTKFNGPTQLSYDWEIGSRGKFSRPNPQYAFPQSAGQYDVKLKVVSGQQCKDSLTEQVEVDAEPQAFLDTIENCAKTQFQLNDQSNFPGFGSLTKEWKVAGKQLNGQNPETKIASSGTFPLQLTITSPEGCRDKTTAPVIINPTPDPQFSMQDKCQDKTITAVNNTSFAGPLGSVTYDWTFGNRSGATNPTPSVTYDTNGTYRVRLTAESPLGCTDTAINQVEIYPKPFPSFVKEKTCDKRTMEFDGNSRFVGNSGKLDYEWDFDDNSMGMGEAPKHTFPDTLTYQVQLDVTDSVTGCTNSVSKTVNIDPQPTAQFSTNEVCQGKETNFTYGGNVPAETYSYDFGDGFSAASPNPDHTYQQTGDFPVTLAVTYQNQQCRRTITDTVTVNAVPEAGFDFNKPAICADDTVSIINNTMFVGSSSNLTYDWSFGNEVTKQTENPVHSFSEGGEFEVKLEVTSSKGCKDQITRKKIINSLPDPGFVINPVDPSTVRVSANNLSYPEYNWSIEDSLVSGTNFNKPNVQFTFDTNKVFTISLMVENRKGCKDDFAKSFEPSIGFPDEVQQAEANTLTAYPNPFASQVNVTYRVNEKADVQVEVLTTNGKRLVKRSFLDRPAGSYQFNLTASDKLPSGQNLLLRVQIGDEVYTKQLIRSE